LFLRVLGVEARKRMAYRVDFWIQALLVFAAELGVVWFVWTAVFEASGKETVGGFTRDGAVLYYVAVILIGKLVRGNEFGDGAMSMDIYEGGLTRYLLYPAPYFGMKYAQNLGALVPVALQFLLFGAAFPFLLAGADGRPTVATVAMAIPSILAANLLYYLMAYPLQGVAFWADNVWSLAVAQRLVSNFLGGVLVPLTVFPVWSQPVLDALPFRHLFSEPVLVLIGRRDPTAWAGNLAIALAWCAGFALTGRLVFRRGSYRYTGVGI
jgi:ABC-2 type transport system permease protein